MIDIEELRREGAAAVNNDLRIGLSCINAADEIGRLRTALRRIRSLDEKNIRKFAHQIAAEALEK